MQNDEIDRLRFGASYRTVWKSWGRLRSAAGACVLGEREQEERRLQTHASSFSNFSQSSLVIAPGEPSRCARGRHTEDSGRKQTVQFVVDAAALVAELSTRMAIKEDLDLAVRRGSYKETSNETANYTRLVIKFDETALSGFCYNKTFPRGAPAAASQVAMDVHCCARGCGFDFGSVLMDEECSIARLYIYFGNRVAVRCKLSGAPHNGVPHYQTVVSVHRAAHLHVNLDKLVDRYDTRASHQTETGAVTQVHEFL